MVVFTHIENVIQEAREYLWVITDQYLPSNIPLHLAAYERGVTERDIELRNWIIPQRIQESIPEEHAQGLDRARASGILEERTVTQLDIHLFMSEQEVAVVAFPFTDGRFDYLGFTSTDDQAHAWCRDIFQYYWEHASPRLQLADELFWWVKKSPNLIRILTQIATGETVDHNEATAELEQQCLIKDGQLTLLGNNVYQRLIA
jgi:hypothetical protein